VNRASTLRAILGRKNVGDEVVKQIARAVPRKTKDGFIRLSLTNGLSKVMGNCHARFLGRERQQCRFLTRRERMNSPELI
jgi:hypothetical protein